MTLGTAAEPRSAQINWFDFIATHGGVLDGSEVRDFGDRAVELAAARDGAALVALPQWGVISVSGPDAGAFLQSQLTSDLRRLSASQAQPSGYCTPQGRLLATFFVVLQDLRYHLVLPRVLAAAVVARLQRYVLRSKVVLEDASDRFRLVGMCGPQSPTAVAKALAITPPRAWEVAYGGRATALGLPGQACLILGAPEALESLWTALAGQARPAGAAAWDWCQIRAGMATVLPETREMFLPQMLGLDRQGGVSFEKGCYPGQEIVARTHYLGELKRQLIHASAGGPAKAGQRLYPPGTSEAAGTVVNAAPSPEGGWEMLAVVRGHAVASAELRLPDGTAVRVSDQAATTPT